jgi:hypothetical protein
MITRVNPYFPAEYQGSCTPGIGYPGLSRHIRRLAPVQRHPDRVISADGEKEPELIPVHDQLRRTPVY